VEAEAARRRQYPARVTSQAATAGGVFTDGSRIELIDGMPYESPALMLGDDSKETIGARVKLRRPL